MDCVTLIYTVCGLRELGASRERPVTHVLSLLDPESPEPHSLMNFDPCCRSVLYFHDDIDPAPDVIVPQYDHIAAILKFGRSAVIDRDNQGERHLLVHCHKGISRSTAAVAMLLAQSYPEKDEEEIFARVLEIRPQAWPNSRMIELADNSLQKGGRLTAALARVYARQLAKWPETIRYMKEHGRDREVHMAMRAHRNL
jgi:predicted protein tyrosine phosphatase